MVLYPNAKRVLFRPFIPGNDAKIQRILKMINEMTEHEVEKTLALVLEDFSHRHLKTEQFLIKRCMEIIFEFHTERSITNNRQLLTGAYFTHEYTLEASALFNPSIIWHYDQSGLPKGSKRFILSLRATGEGHISSIAFRSGILDKENNITFEDISRYVTAPDAYPNRNYDKKLFEVKTREMKIANFFSDQIFSDFPENFALSDLIKKTHDFLHSIGNPEDHEPKHTAYALIELAQSNYEVTYTADVALSERVIFPFSPNERNGMEDARFVEFTEDNGEITYYATYTAYNGRMIFPQLLETKDFLNFKINTLNGSEIQNKGMALFPRKINGNYVMLSRQDNENLFIMFSDHVHFWREKQFLMGPENPWELIQIGNCGSPLETKAGWLVLTHGVGPMRKYCIGAALLDINDPTKVIGRIKEPILCPEENEREGYVPNVVYTCGSIINGKDLIIPYAMSDYCTGFVTIVLDDLLAELIDQQI